MDAGARPPQLVSQRADLVCALAWTVFGIAIVAAALAMERMEDQGGTLYNAPGLVPGLLGLTIAAMGVLLGVRAWRRSAAGDIDAAGSDRLASTSDPAAPAPIADRRGLLVGAALSLLYALGMVGRGVPFWLATWLFVTVYVLLFEWRQRGTAGQRVKGVLLALVYGAGTALVVSVLFEQVFYVRLP